jgi:hypothetical protein
LQDEGFRNELSAVPCTFFGLQILWLHG